MEKVNPKAKQDWVTYFVLSSFPVGRKTIPSTSMKDKWVVRLYKTVSSEEEKKKTSALGLEIV